MDTHTVTNQAPPRVGFNEFHTNTPLVDGVRLYDAAWAEDELEAVGELVGSEQFQFNAELANIHEPLLVSHDRYGNRIDEVHYHPAYHSVISQAVAAGAHTSAWQTQNPAPTSPAPQRSCSSARSRPATPARSR